MDDETRAIALAALCNCARSRGRHSVYCPTATAAPRIREALVVAYGSLLDRLARAERGRDEAQAELAVEQRLSPLRCGCVGYTIRTDYGTGIEHDVDTTNCEVHGESNRDEQASTYMPEQPEAGDPVTTILAIDPGTTESAYALIDADTRRPLDFAKIPNLQLRNRLWTAAPTVIHADHTAIEMVASYGMPVGADVFDTCVWIGRFHTAIEVHTGNEPDLVFRKTVKLHHCHTSKAKDSNITQALVDRFAPGQPNHGKGTKSHPGRFYGFAADIWQAYALAVAVADQQAGAAF